MRFTLLNLKRIRFGCGVIGKKDELGRSQDIRWRTNMGSLKPALNLSAE